MPAFAGMTCEALEHYRRVEPGLRQGRATAILGLALAS